MTPTEFTPVPALAGGLLIGLACLLLLAANGRLAGISGIVGGLPRARGLEQAWRVLFVIGLLAGAGLYALLAPGGITVDLALDWPLMLLAGFIVGIGTRLGRGCTSGHGVCGIGRLSARSLVATITFMVVAAATVFLTRHGF